jgi:hypothetical protein
MQNGRRRRCGRGSLVLSLSQRIPLLCFRAQAVSCNEGSRCLRPAFPTHDELRLHPKQRQLPLLGIEAPQRAHNFLLHTDLVCRITSVELPALHPRGIAFLA